MTEASRLTQIVTTALDALTLPYRLESDVLFIDIPPELRHHFSNRRKVSLTFRPDIWAIDRSLDLIMPGCQFLDALEQALRDRGAGQAIWVGGQLAGSPDLLEAWTERFQIQGGSLSAVRGQSPQKCFLRMIFEVQLPSSPPRTELVPVVWDAERDSVLTPEEQSRLLALPWYGQAEAQGVLPDAIKIPERKRLTQARGMIERELQGRVAQAVHRLQSERKKNIKTELNELKRDFAKRLREAEPGQDAAILKESSRREARLKVWGTQGAEASLLTSSLLFSFSYILQLEYAHAIGGKQILVTPRQRSGLLLDAQCAWCDDLAAGDLLLLRPEPCEHPLACTRCGRACADPACGTVMRLVEHNPGCVHCGPAFQYCSAHDVQCSVCDKAVCPEHRGVAGCCSSVSCLTHLHPSGLNNGILLCPLHAQECSIDGAWFRLELMTQCPISEKWLRRRRAESPEGDKRLLHPDAVVTCASSNVRVARDRAVRCGYDNQWHHPSEMKRCAYSRKSLCLEHRVETTWPPEQIIDLRRLRVCAQSQRKIDITQATKCSVTGNIYHMSLMVKCPVTGKNLHHQAAISPPGDDRTLHPDVVLTCASSRQLVAKDRAVRCADDNRWHHPAEIKSCARTHTMFCPQHRVQTTWKPAQIIDARRKRTCAQTGHLIDASDSSVCSVTRKTYHQSLMIRCPVTNHILHPSAALPDPGAPTILVHPSAIVRCVITNQKMVKPLARKDELTGAYPVHPTALSLCELSRKQTSRKNLVQLSCCKRKAACIPALPDVMSRLISLPDGRKVCTEHFGMCAKGPHPVPRSELIESRLVRKPFCAKHRFTCACHREEIYIGARWSSPYEPKQYYCSRLKSKECIRCKVVCKSLGATNICAWCLSKTSLVTAEPFLQALYQKHIHALVPWYTFKSGITISGNKHVAVFGVPGLLQTTLYRYQPQSGTIQKV